MEPPAAVPPPALGRGVVVGPDEEPPAPWARADRVLIDPDVLAEPEATAQALHRAWAERRPVVIELRVEARLLKEPEVDLRPPYALDPGHTFHRERLHFATWANTYDCRGGRPKWWHGVRAVRLGARAEGPADVVLPDGRPVWCDGGPRTPVDLTGGTAAHGESGVVPGIVHRDSIDAGHLTVSRDAAPRADLAADQMAAVSHPGGPARIIAPAGSGKTRVLSERLRHLLSDRGVEPDLVTAVAYNVKAAEELRQRSAGLRPNIRTLNSLGLTILRWRGQVRVADERESRAIIESLVRLPRQANTDPLAPYLDALSLIRLGLVAPDAAEAMYPDADGLEDLFPRYRAELRRRGAVDFDDQIYAAIEILLSDPAARAWARASARVLLVDEFQDLTPAHVLLIRLLAGSSADVFGVGDDDQVIYGYAGADPDFLIRFDRYFPGAATYELEVNYRCPPAVVRAAGNLLSRNGRRVAKTLRAGQPDGGRLETVAAPRGRLATMAAGQVSAWLEAGRAPGDIAVLARVNAALLPAQLALTAAGIPVHAAVGPEILSRTGMAAALAYVRMGLEPESIRRGDILATIRRPSRRIARNVVEMITKRPATSLRDLHQLADWLSGDDATRVAAFAGDIQAIASTVERGTGPVLRTIRDGIGLGAAMGTLDAFRGAVDRSAHGDDLWALEQAAELHSDAASFEAWLRRSLERDPEPDGVVLSTVHRVKGQEWPCVAVFGATATLFPHRLAQDSEEERRIFHVALTRASQELVIVADATAPSPFLAELDQAGAPESVAGRAPTVTGSRAAAAAAAAAAAPGTGPGAARNRSGRRPEPEVVLDATGDAAFAALRAWRTDQAKRDQVPAFVVMGDAALRGIAAARPATLEALGRCRGIGPAKLEKYGDEILATLEQAARA